MLNFSDEIELNKIECSRKKGNFKAALHTFDGW